LDKLTAELGDLGIAAWIQYGARLRPSEALAVRLDSFATAAWCCGCLGRCRRSGAAPHR
jgi:hypothetical protein